LAAVILPVTSSADSVPTAVMLGCKPSVTVPAVVADPVKLPVMLDAMILLAKTKLALIFPLTVSSLLAD